MIKEKVEYLRGLADGLGVSAADDSTSKLLRAIIDCLGDVADDVDENTEMIDSINDDIDEIYDTLDVYDEVLFDDEDEEYDYDDCDDCCCDECDSDDCEECDCEKPNVICASCGEQIDLDELLNCPRCHKPVFGDKE